MVLLPASHLVQTKVQLKDVCLDQVTVFPLFTEEGKVETLILIRGANIFWVRWRPGLAHKPYFRPLHLKLTLEQLMEVEADGAIQWNRLWHFDCFWALEVAELREHPASEAIRSTNLSNGLPEMSNAFFARDLSKVERIISNGHLLPWVSVPLPERLAFIPEVEEPSPNWILRPFWERSA